MGISDCVGEGGHAAALSITTVIRHKQVDVKFVIEGGNPVIIVNHLTVAVEIKDRGRGLACGIEAAAYRDVLFYGDGVVYGVARGRRVVLSGIENELEDVGLVEQGIVDFMRHGQFYFNTKVGCVNGWGNLMPLAPFRKGGINTGRIMMVGAGATSHPKSVEAIHELPLQFIID
jgi:hypothetical protein